MVRISSPTLQALRAAVDAANALRLVEAVRNETRIAAERQATLAARSSLEHARVEADRAVSRMQAEGERARKAELESRNAQLKQCELEKKLRDLTAQVERAKQQSRWAERAAASSAAVSQPSVAALTHEPLPHPALGVWHSLTGKSQSLHVAPPTTMGEVALSAELQKLGSGLVVLNATIAVGTQEREVDAIVILPIGVFTVEQKDTRLTGTLELPTNGPPTIDDHPMAGGDHRSQARKQSQLLASLAAEEPRINIGFVTPVLAYFGNVVIATEQSGTVLARTTETLADQFATYARVRKRHISRPVVIDLLERLQVPPLVWDEIALAGFDDE